MLRLPRLAAACAPSSHPRHAPWASLPILAFASWSQLACVGDVTVVGAPGDLPRPDACDDPSPRPAAPRLMDVTDIRSGAFVDGHLHLAAKADGVERYLILTMDSPDLAQAITAPDALLGPANLSPVAEGLHARLRTTPAGEVFVDVVDTTIPTAPVIAGRLPIDGAAPPPWASTFSSVEQHLFFCVQPPGQDEPQLAAVDVSDPAHPTEPVLLGSNLCNRYPNGGAAAQGATWMVWGDVSDLNLFSVDLQGANKIGEYLYNPDGIHAYGAVLGAATDGVTAVFDPENDAEFFLIDAVNGPPDGVAHANFGVAGPKRLLAVTAGVATLATPDGVRAYDVSDVNDAKLLPYQADIPFGPGLARLIAASDRFLAVVDGAGALYFVPLDHAGPVSPMRVEEEPPPPVDPPPCGR